MAIYMLLPPGIQTYLTFFKKITKIIDKNYIV